MFKGLPRGLIVAFFANMGERFGFYTMVAIFILFLQAKYGMSAASSSQVYGIFMSFVYFFPLLGGLLADRVLGYSKTISIGMIVMFLGYLLLAMPTPMGSGFGFIVAALATIAMGTGLFKGNLQALVGKMFDDPQYEGKRTTAFSIFYMGINIGAMLAPTAAEWVSNWILKKYHFIYDGRIPAMANAFLKNQIRDVHEYLAIAQTQDSSVTLATLGDFSGKYINALSESYHYGFGVACFSLIASMLIFWIFRKHYKQADQIGVQKFAQTANQPAYNEAETKPRLIAMGLIFAVVIFFWMSFHQNGVTMTYFARDYTVTHVGKATNLWFDLFGLLPIFLAALGGYFAVKKESSAMQRMLGLAGLVVCGLIAWWRFNGYSDANLFTPQKFQHFNPFFIVALTPLVLGVFSWLKAKKKEPSAPRKIGIGMVITAAGFMLLVIASLGLLSPKDMSAGQVVALDSRVSVYWLIITYFVLTIAELFISPMGIAFVSKVAPPKLKGVAQGGWFAATALGNYLLSVIGYLWDKIALWQLWTVLVVCCLLSAAFIFSVMKRLERFS
jgi:proton-dependent oligopeptide transporter, POT family